MFIKQFIAFVVFRLLMDLISSKFSLAKLSLFVPIQKRTLRWKHKPVYKFLLIIPACAITFPIAYFFDFQFIISGFLIALATIVIDIMFQYEFLPQ